MLFLLTSCFVAGVEEFPLGMGKGALVPAESLTGAESGLGPAGMAAISVILTNEEKCATLLTSHHAMEGRRGACFLPGLASRLQLPAQATQEGGFGSGRPKVGLKLVPCVTKHSSGHYDL